MLTVFDKVGLGSDEACSIVIGNSCSKGYNPWDQHWNVTIPGNKPPVTHHSPEVYTYMYTCIWSSIRHYTYCNDFA